MRSDITVTCVCVCVQEQCNGRTALHLAVDLQNLELLELLISKGADVNSVTYGGHSACHLTHGRHNTHIQKILYHVTREDLRELAESEESDHESDQELQSDVEVSRFIILTVFTALYYYLRHHLIK